MGRYRLSHQAETDLREIIQHVAKERPSAAVRVSEALKQAFRTLAANSELGVLREDLRPGSRLFAPAKPAQNYLIFFYSSPEGIEVSTIIHGARDWAGLFDREER